MTQKGHSTILMVAHAAGRVHKIHHLLKGLATAGIFLALVSLVSLVDSGSCLAHERCPKRCRGKSASSKPRAKSCKKRWPKSMAAENRANSAHWLAAARGLGLLSRPLGLPGLEGRRQPPQGATKTRRRKQ